jgi:hypothetical protein
MEMNLNPVSENFEGYGEYGEFIVSVEQVEAIA